MRVNNLEQYFDPQEWKRPTLSHRVRNFIAFGSLGVGKTTLYHHGWRELAEHGIYQKKDIRQLMGVEPTAHITRLNIPRRKHGLRLIDSWIDAEGEKFHRITQLLLDCQKLPKQKKAKGAPVDNDCLAGTIAAITKCKSGIILIIPSYLFMMKKDSLKTTIKEIDRVVNQFLRGNGIFGRNLKCSLLVTQSAIPLPKTGDKLPSDFCENIRYVMQASSLDRHCQQALVVESLPSKGTKVCGLKYEGSKLLPDNPSARFCSAGTALAWVMGILNTKCSEEWGFVVSANG